MVFVIYSLGSYPLAKVSIAKSIHQNVMTTLVNVNKNQPVTEGYHHVKHLGAMRRKQANLAVFRTSMQPNVWLTCFGNVKWLRNTQLQITRMLHVWNSYTYNITLYNGSVLNSLAGQ